MRFKTYDDGSGRDYAEIAYYAEHGERATEVSIEDFEDMLNCMPPIYVDGGFLVCEALTDTRDGKPVHSMFAKRGDKCYGKYVVRGNDLTYIKRHSVENAYPLEEVNA